MSKKANLLIHESSPYLKQHAYNPVNWYPWGEEAINKAKSEDKPILVSIGYSACHWCHVMERESFENDDLAELMNEYLVCIKIDREERPDIDQIYMDAVQIMGINGGWPLNVFITPDLKPFYGGTYFPPRAWAQIVRGVGHAYREKKAEILESAASFAQNLSQSETEKYGLGNRKPIADESLLHHAFDKLREKFDTELGGMDKAPKFPMPCLWEFVLNYHVFSQNTEALEQVELSLDEMAHGGIYDQIGGGFSRYAVDAQWLVPHFEKMLYDNGQLLGLYAKAYRIKPKALYKKIISDTISWLEREMKHESGGYYAALDADSEGIEGKFYVWTKAEILKLFPDELDKVCEFYQIQEEGNWEHGNNILHKKMPDELFAKKWEMSFSEFEAWEKNVNTILLIERSKRIRPGLDDKLLAGWNGLALKGICEASIVMANPQYGEIAERLGHFIQTRLWHQGQLYRTLKDEKPSIPAFLEDYAAIIDGFIALYQVNFNEAHLNFARELCEVALSQFFDEKDGFFFFAPAGNSQDLIVRKKELFDNVIPASNSIMAHNLFKLGHIFENEHCTHIARGMLSKMSSLIAVEPNYLAHWASVFGMELGSSAEVTVMGPDYISEGQKLLRSTPSNALIFATAEHSKLPIFEGRKAIGGKNTFYVCFDKTCKLPVHTSKQALGILENR